MLRVVVSIFALKRFHGDAEGEEATDTPLGSPISSLILSKIIQLKSTLDRCFLGIKISRYFGNGRRLP